MLRFLRKGNRTPIVGDDAPPVSLMQDLEVLYTMLYNPPGPPPAYDWASAGTRSHDVRVKTTDSPFRSSRLAGTIVAGAAIVILTAAGYAAVSSTNLADRLWANFGNTPSQEGSHRVGLSQTIDGITITVEHAVFDGRPAKDLRGEYVPVFVQFTASGLPGGDRRAYSLRESLSSDGVELKRVGGVGLRGHSDILDRELPPGTEQTLLAYDTTGVASKSGSLSLRLEITVIPRADQGSQAGGPETPGVPTRYEAPSGPPTHFSFEFSVPAN